MTTQAKRYQIYFRSRSQAIYNFMQLPIGVLILFSLLSGLTLLSMNTSAASASATASMHIRLRILPAGQESLTTENSDYLATELLHIELKDSRFTVSPDTEESWSGIASNAIQLGEALSITSVPADGYQVVTVVAN